MTTILLTLLLAAPPSLEGEEAFIWDSNAPRSVVKDVESSPSAPDRVAFERATVARIESAFAEEQDFVDTAELSNTDLFADLGVIRGQSPGVAQPYTPQPIGGDPYNDIYSGDPWLGGQPNTPFMTPAYGQGQGYGDGAIPALSFNMYGAEPWRYGLMAREMVTYMPEAKTSSPDVGQFSLFALDLEKEFAFPLANQWTFSLLPQLGYRAWDGPRGTSGPMGVPGDAHLPGSAYRFGLGMKLISPEVSGWTLELGFDPQYGTDFQTALSSSGIQYDAHAALFLRWSPQLTWVLGAAYWDRNSPLILPHAGLVYKPNDFWEFRMVFPRPRVSAYIGTPFGVPTWLYGTGGYYVESFEIESTSLNQQTNVQFSDWRAIGGLRFDGPVLSTFIEAGYVFNRKVDFQKGTDFDIDSGFITRVGLRY